MCASIDTTGWVFVQVLAKQTAENIRAGHIARSIAHSLTQTVSQTNVTTTSSTVTCYLSLILNRKPTPSQTNGVTTI